MVKQVVSLAFLLILMLLIIILIPAPPQSFAAYPAQLNVKSGGRERAAKKRSMSKSKSKSIEYEYEHLRTSRNCLLNLVAHHGIRLDRQSCLEHLDRCDAGELAQSPGRRTTHDRLAVV